MALTEEKFGETLVDASTYVAFPTSALGPETFPGCDLDLPSLPEESREDFCDLEKVNSKGRRLKEAQHCTVKSHLLIFQALFQNQLA